VTPLAPVEARLGAAARRSRTGRRHAVRRSAPPLPLRVVVVSPHCDDAVLSLGATLSRHVRRGGQVTVVTVLAGDEHSAAPAGSWDARAGFRTAGEAARTRRREDRRACRILGVGCVHLDGEDEQYAARRSTTELEAALAPVVAAADEVLVPGGPLRHPDHRLVRELALAVTPATTRVRGYREAPYGSWAADGSPAAWQAPGVTAADERRKWRAVAAYRSQLVLLAEPFPLPLLGVRRAGLLGQLRLDGEALTEVPA
jgi:LmbE family N-acetylglucosaminyl deacetylase